MFGQNIFNPFGNDPFFGGQMQQMQQMQSQMMQGMMSPMMMMQQPMVPGDLAIAGPHGPQHAQRAHAPRQHSRQAMVPAGPAMMDPFGAMFGGGLFQSMMGNMHGQMEAPRNNPNGHFYSSSSVMSYSNTGNGPPKVYQATTSTTQAPGGLRETKKSVRDSEAAQEKMSVGRYLNERGHVVERSRDTRSGDLEENQEYVNLDEEEGAQFDQEWRDRAQRHYGDRGHHPRRLAEGRRRYDHPYHDRSHPRQAYHRPAAIEYRDRE